MVLGVSDFSFDKAKISLGEDGDISVSIKDIEPHLTGTVYNKALIKINQNFKIILQDFILDAKIRIKSKQLSSGEYVPDAKFIGIPDIKFKTASNFMSFRFPFSVTKILYNLISPEVIK